MVSNESVDYRATFPEGIFQFIVLRNTHTYTSVGCGIDVYFFTLHLYFYKNIKEVFTSFLAKEVLKLTQDYRVLIFK